MTNSMQHLLSNITPNQVKTDPFPHLVVENVMDDKDCLRLIEEYPDFNILSKGKDIGNNIRFDYRAEDSLQDESVSDFWKEFVSLNTSIEFFEKFIELFREQIEKEYPFFLDKIGGIESIKSGVHGIDSFQEKDVLIDANIAFNSPVKEVLSSVKIAHLDNPRKLYGGLFYLRHPQDDSVGGNLQVQKLKDGHKVILHGARLIDDEKLEVVGEVPYKRNTLVLFLNTPKSFHGVTPRGITDHPRLFLNLIGECEDNLFDTDKHQEKILRRIIRKSKLFAQN